ncbi:MAG TPA: hypothetical protein VMM35_04855 [Longimicrobiales bacterium]|nr:hypothetical protein [Longimicrobiales bacterium]
MTDLPPPKRWHAPAAASLAALLVGLVACGDDPFSFDWSDAPDTVLLYSLARSELGLESGFSFAPPPRTVVIEDPNATGAWDIAIDTQGGQMVILPPGALGVTARARVSDLGPFDFDDVVEAPGDSLHYEDDQPVPLTDGSVYVVRSNRRAGSFGSSCVYYAKMEPVAIDVAGGTLRFRFVASPICNSRDLIPPD